MKPKQLDLPFTVERQEDKKCPICGLEYPVKFCFLNMTIFVHAIKKTGEVVGICKWVIE